MFHSFKEDISGIALAEQFTYPFNYTPHRLSVMAADAVKSFVATQHQWHEEIGRGKMFGVLVVRDKTTLEVGFLAAFSATLQGTNHHDYFVPPVYDMLQIDSYFRVEERSISQINKIIESLKHSSDYVALLGEIIALRNDQVATLKSEKLKFKQAKNERDILRNSVDINDVLIEKLNRESQFQKAQLKRLERKMDEKLAILEEKFENYRLKLENLIQLRREKSADLQKWLFSQFKMLNGLGEERNLLEIFANERVGFPPAGSGECAGPKLVQYALKMGYELISMAEFWWGSSPKGEIRHHHSYYGACSSKCKPILSFMLQGIDVESDPDLLSSRNLDQIEVVYEDDDIVVVNKPEGMLSVDGKNEKSSVVTLLKSKLKENKELFSVHRLDMATSGLLILAKNIESYKFLQKEFFLRKVNKRYIALLEQKPKNDRGFIRLPLIADINDRPRQKVDYNSGKIAITRYETLSEEELQIGDKVVKCVRVALYPLTGRTHQLRLHASHADGLNAPIVGDNLYANVHNGEHKVGRLYLHAQKIEFTHPKSGETLTLTTNPRF